MKILIVGAGFGGLQAAISLRKKLNRETEISVIDKSDCCLYTPSLYSYLVGESKKEDITTDLRKKLSPRNINFYQEKLEELDKEKKQIKTNKQVHEYDYLILSIGSEIQTFGIKGIENATGFKTIGHANKIKESLKNINQENKITIVGGGLISAELAAHLAHYLTKEKPEISLMCKKFLPGLNENTREKTRKILEEKGTKIKTGTKVKSIGKEEILHEEAGSEVKTKSDLTILATGFKIPEIAKNLGLEYDDSGIKVNSYFETSSENVFSIGDSNHLEQGDISEKKRAQIAEKEGKKVAENIKNKAEGKSMKPYKIKEIPTIVEVPPKYILNYKDISIKSWLVNLMEKFIKLKHSLM